MTEVSVRMLWDVRLEILCYIDHERMDLLCVEHHQGGHDRYPLDNIADK